jgi:alcohol dehydrogenase
LKAKINAQIITNSMQGVMTATFQLVTTLCPGGKERMRRLMELVRHGRLDLRPLLTHTFSLDRITEGYKLFGERREGVIKVAIRP